MPAPPAATTSNFRGFIQPGTGAAFSLDDNVFGFDLGAWADGGTKSGQTLDDFMQQVVAGITGIDQTLVRPRWQPEPPNIPQTAVPEIGLAGVAAWAAVGVTAARAIGGFSYTRELNPGAYAATGFSQQSDWEEFDLMATFYGPAADDYAVKLRQGLLVAQNREALQFLNVGFQQTGPRRRRPELTQRPFLWCVDQPVTFTREIRSFYPVLYYLSAPFAITTDTGVTVT